MFSWFLISIAIKNAFVSNWEALWMSVLMCLNRVFFMSRLVISHSYAIVFLLIKLQQLFFHQDLECRERLISKWDFKREDTCDLKFFFIWSWRLWFSALHWKGKCSMLLRPCYCFPHVNLYFSFLTMNSLVLVYTPPPPGIPGNSWT